MSRCRARGAVVVLGVALLVALVSGCGGSTPLPLPGIGHAARSGDPFAYVPARQAEFVARATAGNANPLFVKSPGGALATAARVAAFRTTIDAATAGTGVDPGTLEGIVFLESAGDPNVIAGSDPANAAGLTQIVAETGQSLLGMHIDLARSRRLTAQIDQALAAGTTAQAAGDAAGNRAQAARDAARVLRLQRARARVDQRFDPASALAATVRYLELAQRRFGRADLAVESYHMGIGNLGDVLAAYNGGHPVPYAQLYFDTSPDHHAAAYQLLSGFGDDSWTYYWRVLAAEQIMRLYRSDPGALGRLASLQTGVGSGALQTAAGSGALVLHPPDRTQVFPDPAALQSAYASRAILPLPSNAGALGLAYDPAMGSLAHRLGASPRLYRGLRAPALDLLIELAARVRALSGGLSPLIVTSTVSDVKYQRLAGFSYPRAAAGWSFTIARRYVREGQAVAFQAMLDRLQSLNVIAWQRYPNAIEISVAPDADRVIAEGV
jgi:hypothetical protein